MDNRPIGVFDSGLGGLTAVRHLRQILPGEDIVYFGDTGRVPYGTRSRDTIRRYASEDCQLLLANDVKYIIADFSETINEKFGKKAVPTKRVQQQKAQHTVSKAAVKNGSFYDPSTLASKLCLVFPELRPFYKENLDKYGEFLGEEFFTKYGTAKVIDAIKVVISKHSK